MNDIQKKYRLCPACYELSEGPGYCQCGGFKRLDFDDLKPEEKKIWEHGFETAKRLILEAGDSFRMTLLMSHRNKDNHEHYKMGYNQALTDYQDKIKKI